PPGRGVRERTSTTRSAAPRLHTPGRRRRTPRPQSRGPSPPVEAASSWPSAGSEVAVARGHAQVALPVAPRRDRHPSKRAVADWIAGVIRHRVLVANAAGNVAPDALQVVERAGEVRATAAEARNLAQRARILVAIDFVVDADGVDRRVRLPCVAQHLVQRPATGVVP